MQRIKRYATLLAILTMALVTMVSTSAASTQDTSPDSIDKSIVWIDVVVGGQVVVPYKDQTEETFEGEALSLCTGWFVSDIGHVATAGHCVETARSTVVSLYASVISENNLNIGELKIDELDWDYTLYDPVAYIGQPSGIKDGPLSGDEVIGQIIDFESFLDGDNALIKIANMTDTPALPLADGQPVVGEEVTAIGFAGSVANVTDVTRQPPSYKRGSVSSLTTSMTGVPSTEIDAAITNGMSGGPTVNADGEVVGINSFKLNGESQPFNFVTDTSAMVSFMDKNNAPFVMGSEAVIEQSVESASPESAAETSVISPETVSNETVAAPSEGTPVLVWVLVATLAIVVILAAAAIVLLMKGRANSTSSPPPTAS